jgi:hypothetical protein
VKSVKSERWKFFFGIVALGGFFYLVDCFWASQEHRELPWLKSGIYSSGLFTWVARAESALRGR